MIDFCRALSSGRRSLIPLTLLFTLVAGPLPTASAAKLYLLDFEARNDPRALFFTPVCNAKLNGVIRPGDFESIKPQYEEFYRHPAVAAAAEGTDPSDGYFALCLSSPGGDIVEAFKLADLFHGWMMVVGEDDQCISACAMLFMRSQRRDFIYHTNEYYGSHAGRYLHYKGKLGFHAPKLEFPAGSDRMLTREEAAEHYARALRTMRKVLLSSEGSADTATIEQFREQEKDFSYVGRGKSYREEMPLDLVVAFLTTPPDEMYEISTVEEVINWGIEIYGFAPPKALTTNMLLVACVNIANLRCQHGVKGDECPDAFESFSTRQYSAANPHVDPGYGTSLSEVLAKWKIAKLKLWPKVKGTDSVSIEAFQVSNPPDFSGPQPCVIRGIWSGDQLFNLEIQTFNGKETSWLGPKLAVDAQEVETIRSDIEQGARDGAYHMRPWKMLPTGTKLGDLATNPWGWLEEGGDFFDKPPNFEKRQ